MPEVERYSRELWALHTPRFPGRGIGMAGESRCYTVGWNTNERD